MDQENVSIAHGVPSFRLRSNPAKSMVKEVVRRKPLGSVNFQNGMPSATKDAAKGKKADQLTSLSGSKLVMKVVEPPKLVNETSGLRLSECPRTGKAVCGAESHIAKAIVEKGDEDDVEFMHLAPEDAEEKPTRFLKELMTWRPPVSSSLCCLSPSSPVEVPTSFEDFTLNCSPQRDSDSSDFMLKELGQLSLPPIDDELDLDFLSELQ